MCVSLSVSLSLFFFLFFNYQYPYKLFPDHPRNEYEIFKKNRKIFSAICEMSYRFFISLHISQIKKTKTKEFHRKIAIHTRHKIIFKVNLTVFPTNAIPFILTNLSSFLNLFNIKYRLPYQSFSFFFSYWSSPIYFSYSPPYMCLLHSELHNERLTNLAGPFSVLFFSFYSSLCFFFFFFFFFFLLLKPHKERGRSATI